MEQPACVFNTKVQVQFFGFLCSVLVCVIWINVVNKEFFKGQPYGNMSFSPLAKYWCDVADVGGRSNKKALCLNQFDFR